MLVAVFGLMSCKETGCDRAVKLYCRLDSCGAPEDEIEQSLRKNLDFKQCPALLDELQQAAALPEAEQREQARTILEQDRWHRHPITPKTKSLLRR
jgi:hypothetical protein